MSAFSMLVKTRAYFLEHWSDTPIQVPQKDFDNDNFPEYIRFEYVDNGNELVSTNCHIEYHGYVKIHCYHKNEILSVKLAGIVKAFFDNKSLDEGIEVKNGNTYPTIKVDNGYYNSLVMFKVEKL